MDILTFHRKGVSQRQIAKKLGISRNTVKKYLDKPEFPESRSSIRKRKSLLDPYGDNIRTWLEEDMDYTARWIYDRLSTMGFYGSYEIVKRKVGNLKAERQKVAYMRFETEPGYQSQVDFGEFQVERADGSIKKLYLFSMILGYSRKIYGELIDKCDLPTFLDCHIRAFEYFGGVPEQILYDRMRNVFIGKIAGRNKFNDTPRINLLRIEEELSEVHLRLAQVTIENLPWQDFVRRYDKADTLFYLDPPYYKAPYYKHNLVEIDDYQELADILAKIKAKFILSINDHPEVKEVFKGFNARPVSLKYSVKTGEPDGGEGAYRLQLLGQKPGEKQDKISRFSPQN